MTMSQKLAAVEAEALVAQQEAASSLSRAGTKRKHAATARSRKAARRSTLNPEELADLIGIE